MTDYEQIKAFHKELYERKENGETYVTTQQKVKKFFKELLASLNANDPQNARLCKMLKYLIPLLVSEQAKAENPPLKKIVLDSMNG